MKGWRRIGIVISVLWFLGFGFFLWNMHIHDLTDPYDSELHLCGSLLDIDNDGLQYVKPGSRDARQAVNWTKYEDCKKRAEVNFHKLADEQGTYAIPIVLAINAVSIALGWLLVWFIVVVVRWVRRGFR